VRRARVSFVAALAVAGAAQAQSLEITLEPSSTSVTAGDVFDVDVMATWSGIPDAGNGNALAAFGMTVGPTSGGDGIAGVLFNPALDINESLRTGIDGRGKGASVTAIGGQLANILGFNPGVDLSEPIALFSFEVQTEPSFNGSIELDVTGQENPAGLVLIYDDSQDGATSSFALGAGDVTINAALVDVLGCPADLTGPGGDGDPDGNLTADDFFFYLGLFADGNLDADLTGPGGDGVPDGNLTADDFFFYLGLFAAGCP